MRFLCPVKRKYCKFWEYVLYNITIEGNHFHSFSRAIISQYLDLFNFFCFTWATIDVISFSWSEKAFFCPIFSNFVGAYIEIIEIFLLLITTFNFIVLSDINLMSGCIFSSQHVSDKHSTPRINSKNFFRWWSQLSYITAYNF